MNNTARFSLSIQQNNPSGELNYSVTDGAKIQIHDQNLVSYCWEYNPKSIFVVSVKMNKPLHLHDTNITIKDLQLNNESIHDLDTIGTYRRSDTNTIEKTYGFMPWPGVYTFKIRFSPITHRYVIHFLRSSCD